MTKLLRDALFAFGTKLPPSHLPWITSLALQQPCQESPTGPANDHLGVTLHGSIPCRRATWNGRWWFYFVPAISVGELLPLHHPSAWEDAPSSHDFQPLPNTPMTPASSGHVNAVHLLLSCGPPTHSFTRFNPSHLLCKTQFPATQTHHTQPPLQHYPILTSLANTTINHPRASPGYKSRRTAFQPTTLFSVDDDVLTNTSQPPAATPHRSQSHTTGSPSPRISSSGECPPHTPSK